MDTVEGRKEGRWTWRFFLSLWALTGEIKGWKRRFWHSILFRGSPYYFNASVYNQWLTDIADPEDDESRLCIYFSQMKKSWSFYWRKRWGKNVRRETEVLTLCNGHIVEFDDEEIDRSNRLDLIWVLEKCVWCPCRQLQTVGSKRKRLYSPNQLKVLKTSVAILIVIWNK